MAAEDGKGLAHYRLLVGFWPRLADAALARGDRVVATARRVESIDDFDGDRVLTVALDVTRDDQVDAAVRAALERFGRIDVLVNNAGYSTVGAVEEIDMDDLRELMETMFFGAVALTKAVLPHMRERGSGAIVQMSSQGGQMSFAGAAPTLPPSSRWRGSRRRSPMRSSRTACRR